MAHSPESYEKWKKKQIYRRQRRRYWISKYKTAKGCELCGYNKHPAALDWDHLDRNQKIFLPSARNLNINLKRLFKEIRKCRLLCSNCHREISYEEKHFNNNGRNYGYKTKDR